MKIQKILKGFHQLPTTIKHCGILTLVFGSVLLAIFLTHPNAVYGAQTDWSNQHFAIPEYFRTRFYATGNWFPNLALHLGGGQNIYNFAYYGLYNPVILLSYAFPQITMATYLQVASILLTLCSAYLCYFWLKKWFVPRIALFAALLFLCASPVIFHSHHHIMFTNYFPFLFWGFCSVHQALERRCSISLLIASIGILLSSFFFSVGAFFALVIYAVFVVLYQHHVHVVRQVLRALMIMAVHLVLATIITAFFLLPVAYTLLHGRDDTTSTISLWKILLPGIHLRYFTYSPFSIGMTSFGVFVLLVMFRSGLRACRFLSTVFLALLCLPIILYLMNGTMYLDPKAYIPFLPLLVLLCGFFLQRIQVKALTWMPTMPLFLLVLVAGYWMHDGTQTERIALLIDGSIMCIALMLYYLRKNRRFLWIPTLVISLVQCFTVNIGDSYMSKEALDVVYSEEIGQLVDTITENDDGFYRISNEYHAGDTVNRVWNADHYRSTVYSSIHTPSFSDFYFHQTYNENSIRNAAMIVQSKNPIFGILMGEKYIISQKPIDRYGMQLIEQNGDYLLYENTLAFPIGFATPHVMEKETLKSIGYPANLPALLENAIVSADDIPEEYRNTAKVPYNFRKITVPYHASGYSAQQVTYVSDGYYVHSQEEFTVTVTFEKPISDLLLLQMHVNNRLGDGSTTGDVAITVNGIRNKLTDPDWKYQNLNNAFRYTLSSNEPIRELKVTFSSGDYIISDVALYTISYQALEDAGDQITPFQVKHADIGDDTISGSIDVTQDSWFVLSVPYDEGFSCFVDGKEVPIVKTDMDFIGFPISAGFHQIAITYHAPGSFAGIRCSALGIGAAILWFGGNTGWTLWDKHHKRKRNF